MQIIGQRVNLEPALRHLVHGKIKQGPVVGLEFDRSARREELIVEPEKLAAGKPALRL